MKLLFDPQTAGGMLIAIAESKAEALLARCVKIIRKRDHRSCSPRAPVNCRQRVHIRVIADADEIPDAYLAFTDCNHALACKSRSDLNCLSRNSGE